MLKHQFGTFDWHIPEIKIDTNVNKTSNVGVDEDEDCGGGIHNLTKSVGSPYIT